MYGSYVKGGYNLGCKRMFWYRIEVERQDIINGGLVNIERNSVNNISTDKEKVKRLFDLVSKNNVSPIHLIDVIGEYVDEYVSDFN